MVRISDTIKEDHRLLREYHDKIIHAGDEDTGTRWGNKFTWELARYTVAEELVVYPALESYIDHGKIMADKDRRENQEIKEQLYKFQRMSAQDSEFRPTLDSIMERLNKHIEEEEDEDLASLESVIQPDESRSLAKKFERTKMFVPTRAHPHAPKNTTFESVVSFLEAPLDKLEDMMRRFPESEE
ncbi:HHE domain-containing protein [Histoplasma capsulatum G186AR]|uniref:HHE domain-containing protein n=1 Tax=Ajellomyces capsulatus (strain G186AR / H82 / ATCC MYA-2454 / RMSCC 2432) TaxID=447093 RepID=C0NVD6_AJECG|nr:HHE domain-containing protein [Histoplasma capsulatum G186AR]EEH04475.1 HHE domain-containing protein [Histoplasma capsulatum G186AR]